MLRIDRLSKHFGQVRAVDDVSLDIPEGQMVGIIGRSGAGKSTLLRLINRLAEPTSGQILHDESDVTALQGRALRDWRSACAMIFQQFNLVGRLDVLTNVLIGRSFHHSAFSTLFKLYTDAERTQAIHALDRLGLADQALQRADTLSGGQQQRVAIARALVQEPTFLLADEPIASLDPANAALVMDALRHINRELGLTVLCNLHTLDTAREYCDRIVAMASGRVVLDGTPADLTPERVREVYGVDHDDDGFRETITSTAAGSAPAVQRVA